MENLSLHYVSGKSSFSVSCSRNVPELFSNGNNLEQLTNWKTNPLWRTWASTMSLAEAVLQFLLCICRNVSQIFPRCSENISEMLRKYSDMLFHAFMWELVRTFNTENLNESIPANGFQPSQMKIAPANTYIQRVVLLCTNTRTSDIWTHQCKYNHSLTCPLTLVNFAQRSLNSCYQFFPNKKIRTNLSNWSN